MHIDVFCLQIDLIKNTFKMACFVNQKMVLLSTPKIHVHNLQNKIIRMESSFRALFNPDLARTDFHLFRELEHLIERKIFGSSVKIGKSILYILRKKKCYLEHGVKMFPFR